MVVDALRRHRVVLSCFEAHTPGNCYQGEVWTLVQMMSEQWEGEKKEINPSDIIENLLLEHRNEVSRENHRIRIQCVVFD